MEKVILITGAARGIGRASALRLMADGHTVYGGDIAFDEMADLEQEGMRRLPMDVTDDAQVKAAVATVVEQQGRIDGLFANAGYTCMGPIECVTIDEAKANFEVNVWGVARAVKAVLPHMRSAGQGHIVITSSVVGLVPVPGMAWYPATKHALEAFSNALRMEVKRFGIRVAIINPGFIQTNLLDASLPTLDRAAQSEFADVYAQELENFRELFTKGFNNGASVDTISKAVSKAFASKNPKHHFRPNADSIAGTISARFMPDSISDAYTYKTFLGDIKAD